MPMPGSQFLHLPVTLRPGDSVSWPIRTWERLLARLFNGEPVPVLPSDPAYPATLCPGPFGLERAC